MQSQAAVAAITHRAVRSSLVVIGLILVIVLSATLGLVSPARGASAWTRLATPPATAAADRLKAVIVVGPTHELTASNLEDGEELARLAESYGMDVRRVFHPRATWENVLANIQGANFVAYMGHGYGWPSPYTTKMTESRQNGMGLNPYEGASKSEVKYYGATPIREQITLAPNALVFLNHLCYAAGNGESFMATPSWDVARQRVDNFAAGFLAAGASGVFAYSWQSGSSIMKMLHTTNKTMEQIFTTAGAYPNPSYGFIGWDARKFESLRTPGVKNYLDPHSKEGFLRAFTGEMSMSASEWKGGQGDSDGGSDGDAPVLSGLSAVETVSTVARSTSLPMFTPNGDGISDSLVMTHTVSEAAFLDFEVRNASGTVVRQFTEWTEAGAGQSSWNGKRDNGNYVGDGVWTVRAKPRDSAGNVGAPSSFDVQVLTTMRSPAATPALFFARDGDALAPAAQLSVTLATDATLSWKVVDGENNLVRSHLDSATMRAGSHSWTWDGRNDAGGFVADGTYFSLMTATTAAGKYTHRVAIQTGAFTLTPNAATASRGEKVKFVIVSAEPLSRRPRLKVTQPGLPTFTVDTVKVASRTYRAVVTFRTGGGAGTVQLLVVAVDTNGVKQTTAGAFPLK